MESNAGRSKLSKGIAFSDEDHFVRWLRRRWPDGPPDLGLGIGDDAAIVRPTPGCDLALTSDLSLEGVHFQLDLHPAQSVGHRALARSISDLAAMGARPRFALLSLSLPQTTRRSWISAFYDGLGKLARSLGVTLIGGDTAVTKSDIIVADVMVVGEAGQNQELRRSGARPGDRIYVTGTLGMSALGLALLKAGARPARGAVATSEPRVQPLQAHLYPEPRCRVGIRVAQRGLASAAIDVSDGFARDLARLCDASGRGAIIWEDRLPLVKLRADQGRRATSLELGLYGGEDYELLFTVPQAFRPRVPRAIGGVALHSIGEIQRVRGLTLLRQNGDAIPIEPRGYDHFRGPAIT